MLKVTVHGDAVIVESDIKMADLKKVGPLTLVDAEKNELVYSVIAASKGSGYAGDKAIAFDYANKDGNACVNLQLSTAAVGEAAMKEAVADAYGVCFTAFNANEAALKAQIEDRKTARAAMLDGISIG